MLNLREYRASADRLQLLVPFANEALAGWIQDTVVAAGDLDEAYIRVLLTRGVGELSYDIAATPAPSLVIIVKPLDTVPVRIEQEGITISLVQVLRNHPGSRLYLKCCQSLPSHRKHSRESVRRCYDQ